MSPARIWTFVMAVVVVLAAVIGILESAKAPRVAFDSLGSGTVPLLISLMLLLLCAAMLVEEFLSKSSKQDDTVHPVISGQRSQAMKAALKAAGGFLAFIGYVVLLQTSQFPFWAATFAFIFLSSEILTSKGNENRLASAIVAIVVAIGIQVVFTQFLLIDLP